MRYVLDTNVLVAAMRSKTGASAKLVDAARRRVITPVANVALFVEYEAVLTRPEHLAAAGVSRSDVYRALDALASVLAAADGAWRARPATSDGDDDMVLEAAVNGRADGIVTFETRTFLAPAAALGIEVLTPAAAYAKVAP